MTCSSMNALTRPSQSLVSSLCSKFIGRLQKTASYLDGTPLNGPPGAPKQPASRTGRDGMPLAAPACTRFEKVKTLFNSGAVCFDVERIKAPPPMPLITHLLLYAGYAMI